MRRTVWNGVRRNPRNAIYRRGAKLSAQRNPFLPVSRHCASPLWTSPPPRPPTTHHPPPLHRPSVAPVKPDFAGPTSCIKCSAAACAQATRCRRDFDLLSIAKVDRTMITRHAVRLVHDSRRHMVPTARVPHPVRARKPALVPLDQHSLGSFKQPRARGDVWQYISDLDESVGPDHTPMCALGGRP